MFSYLDAYMDNADPTLSGSRSRSRYSVAPTSSASSVQNELRSFEAALGHKQVEIRTSRSELLAWIKLVIDDLNKIALLESDWDSYGASEVSQRALEHSLDLAIRLMEEVPLRSSIYPTRSGGITLEWHKGSRQLQVEIGELSCQLGYYYDSSTGEEWEPDIPVSREDILAYLRKVNAS